MKKTIAALAVLGAFAGSAAAADVTVYGVVDTGLLYKWQDTEGFYNGVGVDSESAFTMESGLNSASRFGLKGSEDLGNGMKVSFKLENGFDADDGELGQSGRLFGRESSVSLTGNFGTVSFGRMGGVASSAGTYDIVYATADAFDGGDNDVLGLAISSRYDNMVTYQTPVFGAFQATAQYSFKNDSKAGGDEGKSSADRYGSFAVTGSFGALNLVGAWEMQNRASGSAITEDGNTFYVGGNYDCGFAKTFFMAQYFMNGSAVGAFNYDDIGYGKITSEGFDGFGLHLGTQFPALAGNVTIGLYYVDATAKGTNGSDANTSEGWSYSADFDDVDTTYYGIAGRYEYSLSKRTLVYAGAGYYQLKADAFTGTETNLVNPSTKPADAHRDYKDQVAQAYIGLKHTF